MSGPSSQSSRSQRSASSMETYDSSESRATSVSSIRNTNVPPKCRANAQLNNVVRMRPTCGLPVGEGEKRTRTSDGARSPSTSSSAVPTRSVTGITRASSRGGGRDHAVGQRADAFDGDGDLVALDDRPDAGRGAGEDDVAREQGERIADVR